MQVFPVPAPGRRQTRGKRVTARIPHPSGAAIADGFLHVDGRRLEAEWLGPAPGLAPTLVFLHEGLGCVRMWKDFPRKLAEATGCGALVYSRFGYGASDPCSLPRRVDYMHGEAFDVLPRVLEASGIRDAILVGHSDGGSIALLYCGGTPAAEVRGGITLGAHVFVEDLSVESIALAKTRYHEGDLRAKLERFHGAAVDEVFRGWNDIWLHPDFRRWNIEAYLPHIRVPFLVIQGDDDQYGTPGQVAAIARGSGGAVDRLMVPECNHWPHLEQEQITLDAMRTFVAALLRSRQP
ncbi:MAG: alpha/beta hydrolase [Gammaproteobacteria bacterium]|nr:alpha/beta hydrolase [Gammaproteobacteria bacterium]